MPGPVVSPSRRESNHAASHRCRQQVPATFRGWLHRIGNTGVIKLVVDRRAGILVGATSVGPRGAEVLAMLTVAVLARAPVEDLLNMIYAFPTFHGGVGEALGAYGRGVGRVLDPDTEPMFGDWSFRSMRRISSRSPELSSILCSWSTNPHVR